MRERRRHVRVRPVADHDVVVELIDGGEPVRLSVLDISSSGIGLFYGLPMAGMAVGDTMPLRLTLPGRDPFEVEATIRHMGGVEGSACGVELTRIEDACSAAIRRYVGELLERGQAV